jgi:hypothetical protein
VGKSMEDLKKECDFNENFTNLLAPQNKEFIQLMLNRMIVGYAKYGSWKNNRVEVDAVKNAHVRIDKYLATGNTEWLTDAANFIMMEFTRPIRANTFYSPVDNISVDQATPLEVAGWYLSEYRKTNNQHWLVCAANCLVVEFTVPLHKNAHFKGTDSHEAPPLAKF